ncbi:MAG: class I SAM-dependent methyltransferase [Syntrophaceae bacterium]|nr:class I SAM-dependent methyltransferase [Syntrophaceae bacterium]
MKKIDSNKEWKKWGEIDPLFGVASWKNREKNGSNPWTDRDFYQLGEKDWRDFLRHWEKYGVNKESCLEIGCGAGRITMQLASYFNSVHAIDVSDKMIEYAKNNISTSSVIFFISNGFDIPLHDQSVYSVFSTHVFQHFDSLQVAESYFAEISRVMKPSGTLMIHLPIYKWPSQHRIFKMIYAARNTISNVRAKYQRLLMQYGHRKPIMRQLMYPLEYFYEYMPKYNFKDIELSVFVTKSNNVPHPFLFARRNN